MASKISQFRRVSPALVDQRQAPRHRVLVTSATVRQHGEAANDAALHDLSVYGCRLMSSADHRPGERLWLRFGGSMPVAATVIWNDGDSVGCRFDAPIARELMRSLTLLVD